jgi:hypothetical protein
MDPQGRAFLVQQMIGIAIGFAISLAISFLVPFPYSLGIMMGVFLGISYAIRAWAMRKIRRSAGHFNESIYDYILGFSQGKAEGWASIIKTTNINFLKELLITYKYVALSDAALFYLPYNIQRITTSLCFLAK